MMKLKFRKIAYQLHLWLGLTSGLIIVIMASTGCILAFEDELKQLIHPQRYFVDKTGSKKLPLSELCLRAEQALPESLTVKRVQISSDPSRTYVFRTLKMNNDAATFWGTYVYYYRIYIDPYSGKVQDVEDARKDFFEIVLNLHRRLLLGEKIGKTITGYATIVFTVLLLSGLVIWYPRKMSKAMLKGMFFIKTSANWKRVNYDVHNVLGFYAIIPLLLICYSALIWNFEDLDQWMEKTLNANAPQEKKAESKVPAGAFTHQKNILDLIGHKVLQDLHGKKSALISFPRTEKGTYYAELTIDNRYYRNIHYTIDQYSGDILKYQSYKDNLGSGSALRARNYDLHTGSILGTPGRLIYFLAAIIATSLPVTGFIIYLNKKKKKPKKKSKT
ncbi:MULTISPECIES: PepSY-associated TM helix domain-containing protein [Chryseobacterium]|uniref:Iron-regulated membrane protein n=1 Tax=Chryseobacterium camelliae TaxID=1265445 RepID=A0ABU0TKB3_9FLAO|nr:MULTISPECIES: PepSY-associated TM helix domain-containing protein [Chryseobacterium]MDT3409472.1 putative iron-regulated membrane protein [Pseudacidovorax intermedius]MDQ1096663.1 putative iron-regulated membrane protein [Chryseobacterium camelliae]MDQ1100607.1 putative iron-regulated membrane protein [Chryseobacterium sp. SORGH_AS_1048]MDR6087945.1 putative iron-regulated membrane protein [Chryseobacterium sp. SORGH_AS_0909]MDR6132319.1 putative iron-regulated membrane protein [Chryseobact